MPANCRDRNELRCSHLEKLLLRNPEHMIHNVGQIRPNFGTVTYLSSQANGPCHEPIYPPYEK